MAQHLGLLTYCASIALCAGVAVSSFADMPHDPTQPPANIMSGSNNTTVASTSVIQSITIRGKQRFAMINGIMMKLGDSISEGRIVNITETAVIVRSTNGLSVLKLFPNVDKHAHTHAKPTRQPSVHRN